MRRWLPFAAATVLLATALAGPLLTTEDPRSAFDSYYQDKHGRMSYTEGQLYGIGVMNCRSLKAGYSLPDVYTDNLITGLSGDQSAFTIDAAITVLCPEFSHLLQDMQ
jgi:hypothetical protein